jgi:signal peptidase I
MELLKMLKRKRVFFLTTAVLTTIVMIFIFQPMGVDGVSMRPTIDDGDRAFILSEPFIVTLERGDIITFTIPQIPGRNIIKRIVGLPGELIEINLRGSVSVNGETLEEPYVREPEHNPYPMRVIMPKDSYFVMGDNRPNSEDSRNLGPIPRSAIFGKVILFYWHFDKMFTVPHLGPHLYAKPRAQRSGLFCSREIPD